MRTYKLILTPETFDIGGPHYELRQDEVFLGVVPPFVFDLMGWKTKRQGTVRNGKGAAFVKRREMIDAARNKDGRERRALLKTLLEAEKTRRYMEWLEEISADV